MKEKPKYNRLTDEQKAYIMSNASLTYKELADAVGCQPSSVLRLLRREGVEHNRWDEKKARAFMRMYNDSNIPPKVIAKTFGIGETCARYTSVQLAKRFNIKRVNNRSKRKTLTETDIDLLNEQKK